MRFLIINPGATSTKIAIFEDGEKLFQKGINHSAEELAKYDRIVDQMPFRRDIIVETLEENGYSLDTLDAICSRGGMFRHIPSGTYKVNDTLIADIMEAKYGEHAANIGPYIAREIGDSLGIPSFFVDPVCVDEMDDVARYSGMKGFERQSFFHALNQKAIARKTAAAIGKEYEEANIIVVHMGGGVSVVPHKKGRAVDVNNVRDEGSMSMDRGGSVPVQAVIDYCFDSGKTKVEIKSQFGHSGGVFSYTGTKDFLTVENKAFDEGDEECLAAFNAIAYQLAKDVGAMAAVLSFDVDAIALTGGMAYSERFCNLLESYFGKLAPVFRFPGEEEMQALADGCMRAMKDGNFNIY